MQDIKNPFTEVAEGREVEAVASWLKGYLLQEDVDPYISIPADFPEPATYLLTYLGAQRDLALGRKFADATFSLLLEGLRTGELIPTSDVPQSSFLWSLLTLLEALPSSASDKVAKTLNYMRISEDYKQWPTSEQDYHRLILLAMANHLRARTESLSGWESDLEKEMDDSRYAVAAFSVLLELSPSIAIKHLPQVLRVLRALNVSSINLLFGVAVKLGTDMQLWNKIADYLSGGEWNEEITLLCGQLKNLGYFEIADRLREGNLGHKSKVTRSAVSVPTEIEVSDQSILSLVPSEFQLLVSTQQSTVLKDFSRAGMNAIIPHLLENLKNLSENEITNKFTKLFSFWANGNSKQLGMSLGEEIGKQNSQWGSTEIQKLWRAIRKASYSAQDPNQRLISAFVVRGYCEYHFTRVWQTDDDNVQKSVFYLCKIQSIVRQISNLCKKSGISRLYIGCSRFHEDKILSSLAKIVFSDVRQVSIIINETVWGDMESEDGEVDIAVINERALTRELKGQSGTHQSLIYNFKGYYIFANASTFCEKFKNNGATPGNVRSIPFNQRLQFAISLNLQYPKKTDYEFIIKKLTKRSGLGALEGVTHQSLFNVGFESFLKGEDKVFIGGASHARLLRRWWNDSQDSPFVTLINPDEIWEVMGNGMGLKNRLVFSGQLKGKKKHSDIKKAITELYKTLGDLIIHVSTSSETSDDINTLRKFMLRSLFDPQKDTYWGFITHEEDLCYMLSNDDNFAVASHPSKGKISKKNNVTRTPKVFALNSVK